MLVTFRDTRFELSGSCPRAILHAGNRPLLPSRGQVSTENDLENELVAVLLVAVAAVLGRNLQNLAATIDPFDRKILPAAIEKQFLAPTSTPLERNNGRDFENLERRRKGHRRYTYIYIYRDRG